MIYCFFRPSQCRPPQPRHPGVPAGESGEETPSDIVQLRLTLSLKPHRCFCPFSSAPPQSSEAHPTVMLFALIALEKFSQTSTCVSLRRVFDTPDIAHESRLFCR